MIGMSFPPEGEFWSKFLFIVFISNVDSILLFLGEVTITFTVNNSTSEINLHHRLTITDVLVSSGGESLQVSNTAYDNTTEIYTITLQNALTVGIEYSLNLK